MAKNTVSILSGGTSYYLSGGALTQTVYDGSGTPWTAETTTPYELSLNDRTPIYAPTAAPGMPVVSAGGITTWGAEVVAVGYDSVTEQIGVQMRGTTHDNAVVLLRQLRQIVTTGRRSYPPLLAIQSGTNTGFFEILWADVAETVDYIIETAGTLRAVLTIVRAPHAMPSAATTLLNGVTFTNDGTEQSLGSLTGELIHEGHPMNVELTGGQLTDSSAGQRKIYAAVVASAEVSPSIGFAFSGSSTTPGRVSDPTSLTPAALAGTHFRCLARVTSPTTNFEARYVAVMGRSGGTLGDYAYGPWARSNGTQNQMIDLGPLHVPISLQEYMTAGNQRLAFDLDVRSGDGSAASATIDRIYVLQAYTFCTILDTPIGVASTFSYILNGFVVYDGAARIATPSITGLIVAATDEMTQPMVPRGTIPRAFSGASLWLNWQRMNTGHATSNTITVTAQTAPLYRTIRGGA